MEDQQQLPHFIEEKQIREALKRHWHASAAGDASAELDIYGDDAICDYPLPAILRSDRQI
jgi:ketosteroid isomerase-like protein